MTTKVRKQIYLDHAQEVQLKRLALATGLSEAELIRRTLNLHLGLLPSSQPRDLSAWEEEKRFIKEWMAQGPVAGGRTWKREDLYDRQVLS
jgi:hypothetical protein